LEERPPGPEPMTDDGPITTPNGWNRELLPVNTPRPDNSNHSLRSAEMNEGNTEPKTMMNCSQMMATNNASPIMYDNEQYATVLEIWNDEQPHH